MSDLDRRLPSDSDEQWREKQEARKQLAIERMRQHDAMLEARRERKS